MNVSLRRTIYNRRESTCNAFIAQARAALADRAATIDSALWAWSGPRLTFADSSLAVWLAGAPLAADNTDRTNLKPGAMPRRLKLQGELPMLARNLGLSKKDPDHLLLPGSYCTMRVLLDEIKPATLLPADAVFSRGGRHYICTITRLDNGKGKVHLEEVEFLDDGVLSRVSILDRNPDGKVIGRRDVRPGELVVWKNQGELTEGQEIDWKQRAWKLNKQKTRVEVDSSGKRKK
jgi:hypothetical protein